MSEKPLALSRRKILAGIGAAGVASVGAGLGTSAYFNDVESFENNSLTAGELDLRVDWQQLYYGPTESWEFVNAHPDDIGDGEQSIELDGETYRYSDEGQNIVDVLDCDTLGQDYESNFGDQDSLVSLGDVKPGDEGEITFSLHLCDNPGYIWLTADDFSESGGATPDPEEEELGEGESDDGELAENMNVEFWYDDNCNNSLDGGESGADLDVMLVLDRSGSMTNQPDKFQDMKDGAETLVNTLTADDQAGLASFAGSASRDQDLTDTDASGKIAVNGTIQGLSSGGSTNIAQGIEYAAEELLDDESLYGTSTSPSGNAESDHTKIMVVLSNGGETIGDADAAAQTAKDNGIRVFSIAYGSGANTTLLQNVASSGDFYDSSDVDDIEQTFEDIAEDIAGETLILGKGDGVHDDHVTLAEAMEIMESNGGMVPLDGTGDMEYGDGPTSEARDCFEAGQSYCIGAHWWVPTDVGNEIQGDSVEFDLGFYAEQCRHNDGSGPESVPE
ncbi:vWA domain-containing protein [Haloarchaeobius litoreus]|uniref:VWA domain-containing protein n=1 Tax=Haloarchaeobius litoreus TaxID=755306 RepID=A0ABD6DGH5_9EURY|nr:vWA domain-containing protein [Haloarchaeobius litoreus]